MNAETHTAAGPKDLQAMGLSDSSLVTVATAVLIPSIPLVTLWTCLLITGETFHGGYLLICVLVFLLSADFLGSLKLGEAIPAAGWQRPYVLDIPMRWFALVALVGGLAYASGLSKHLSDEVMLVWVVVTPFALIFGRHVEWAILRSRSRWSTKRNVVIVGATDLGRRLEQSLKSESVLTSNVVGFFEDRCRERLTLDDESMILGTTSEIAEYVAREQVTTVYITLPISRQTRILSLIESLGNTTVSIYFVPDLAPFGSIQPRLDIVSGLPVVAIRETPYFGLMRVVKRATDLIIAGVAVIALAPVFAAIALGVKLDSRGPVLFKQKRYGLNGLEIHVFKFRSMRVTEDGKAQFKAAIRGDPRITKFGAFIRATSLDELPQLFNVIAGSMSIVGPRPHPVAMNEQYRTLIPSYMVRHKVKPGITGWAQVNGYRGGDDLESMKKRIEFDLQYLRNWSLWLDIRILMRTVTVLWGDRHAF